MIELAPGHKQGLPVTNPVLIAGGAIGYGEVAPPGLDLSHVGGVVVGPILAAARPGSEPPRVAESPGGLVLATGLQNRGVAAALRKHAKLWTRLGCPFVVQIADTDAKGAAALAGRVSATPGVLGLELLPLTTDPTIAVSMVRAVLAAADLPLWVKLRLDLASQWARPLTDAGAHALVVGRPPVGRSQAADGRWVTGELHGPLAFPLMLEALAQVAARTPDGPALIACGGIHTADQLRQALAAGAVAVQIDSALWVEPSLPLWLIGAWATGFAVADGDDG
jgi:dihydroorotate dehydrogenase (NAD+) catalytic subunit